MMKNKNRQVCISSPGQIELRQIQIRPLCEDEVLIEVAASAICGSDLHIYKGKHPSVQPPATVGHEFCGIVVHVGHSVSEKWIGKRVAAEPCLACGTCPACIRGEYDLCDQLSFIYRTGYGALADYVIVKENKLFEIPDEMSFRSGAMIEPLSVALHGVMRGGICKGENVYICGDGVIGILTAAACKNAGAGKVFLSGHNKRRLALAMKFGADSVCNSHEEDAAQWLKNQIGQVDAAFECVGKEECLHTCLSVLRRGGRTVITGIYEQPRITMTISELVSRQLSVLGTQGYRGDFPKAIELAQTLPMEELISGFFSLEEAKQAFEEAADRSRGHLKIVIEP